MQKINLDDWRGINNVKISGIYMIAAKKKYIGSSNSVIRRVKFHNWHLAKNSHINKELQKDYNNGSKIDFILLEECSDEELLQKEELYMHMYPNDELYNTWTFNDMKDIEDFLNLAKNTDQYRNQFRINHEIMYNGTACKESLVIGDKGYGKVSVKKDGMAKNFKMHRISYWHTYGEYPHLVRHMCNNKACYNPLHLQKGSNTDNRADTTAGLLVEFESKWVDMKGDVEKVSDHFGYSRSDNFSNFYKFELRLGLAKKYPEIVIERYNQNKGANMPIVLRDEIQSLGERGFTEREIIKQIKEKWGVTKLDGAKIRRITGANLVV